MALNIIEPQVIPEWLHNEVEEYFVIPLPFEPKTVLDIGANIGAFAQRAQKIWPNATVICCEPMPFNVSQLRRNVADNTVIVSAAIRAFSGIDEILVGDSFVTGGFHSLGRQTAQRILVECIAAKELPSCELVKIDTEGCEVEILKNLSLHNTQAIFLEHHSRTDAEIIKSMLTREFDLVNADSGNEIGTFCFVRKNAA